MREEWATLEEFPLYSISNYGRLINLRTECLRKPSQNAQGIAKVTLYNDAGIFTKSLAVLVAQAHLPNDRDPKLFNCPINLDGDRMNCAINNLLWRPRWFAMEYHRQFRYPEFHTAHPQLEIIQTGERFYTIKAPAIKYGLLYGDIIMSFLNKRLVFPTKQEFREFI